MVTSEKYATIRNKQSLPLKSMKDLNYLLPCPEDIFAKLNGGKFFSKIGLSDAYLQIPVEEASLKLLCINTHRGLCKFERLPFGVKVAQAIFQQVIDTMLSSLDFVVAYLDDILMKSKSIIEHKEHVHKVFTKIQDYSFKLKETKCHGKNQIPGSHYGIRMVEGQILNELLQLKTYRHQIISLHNRVYRDLLIITRYSYRICMICVPLLMNC